MVKRIVQRQTSRGGRGIKRTTAAEHLERAVAVSLLGLVDDAARAFAELAGDGERSEGLARLELLLSDDALGAELAKPLIDLGARGEHRVHERVDCVALEAAIGERAGERSLGSGAADLAGIEPEQIGRQGHHFFQREEAL